MMPLEKDPTREVGLQTVTMPPGAGNEFHRHPGEQWTAIQEGEITFTIKGKPAAGAQGRRIQLRPARHSAPPAESLRQVGALHRDADFRQGRAGV